MRRVLALLLLLVALGAVPGTAAAAAPVSGEEGTALTFTAPGPGYTATTGGGTATPTADYQPLDNALPSASNTVDVQTVEDTTAERDETVVVTFRKLLSNDVSVVGTIVDDDAPALSVADATVREGAGSAQVVVTTTPVDRAVSVGYTLADGSAGGGRDYDPAGGRLTIPAGAAQASIAVPITNDADDEPDETFSVTLGAPASATIADGDATVTIANDDLRQLTIGDAGVTERDGELATARVPVSLSAPTFRTVTVQFATIDGSARAPRDYLARLGTLTFAPGQTTQTVDVGIVADDVREPAEAFGVILARPDGATVARDGAVVAVTDDDTTLSGDGTSADATPPNVHVSKPKRRGRTVSVRVSCPRNEARCIGRLTLYTSGGRERRLGRATFDIKGGANRTVKLTLPRSLKLGAKPLKVRAYVVTRDPAGNVDTTTVAAMFRR